MGGTITNKNSTVGARRPKEVISFPREVEKDTRATLSKIDEPFTILALLLLAVGLICLFSASYAEAYYNKGNGAYYVLRQGVFAAAGVVAMFVAAQINYHKLHYFALPLMAVSVVLMASIKIVPSIWITINKATRWIGVGDFFTFQPSEIAKFAVILCFSSMVTLMGPKKMHTLRYGIMPFAGIIVVMAGLLYLEPHLSATVIIAGIGVVIIFLGGANMGWILGAGGAGAAGVAAFILTKGYAMQRIQVWLDPFVDPKGDGWQGVQSLLAIGSGGFWGVGLGLSRQKQLFLPEPANDFIFSVVCEELGFVGAVLILLVFAALVMRGYYIAMRAPDKFGTLLAAGITTQVAIQVIFNVGVVTGLLPVTGASLPFFSYGGTSLLMLMGEMGIVLSVSRRIPAPKQG